MFYFSLMVKNVNKQMSKIFVEAKINWTSDNNNIYELSVLHGTGRNCSHFLIFCNEIT